jgi:hypothetical protein
LEFTEYFQVNNKTNIFGANVQSRISNLIKGTNRRESEVVKNIFDSIKVNKILQDYYNEEDDEIKKDSSDEDRKNKNHKIEKDKIKIKIQKEKKVLESELSKNKKYIHIKSKFLNSIEDHLIKSPYKFNGSKLFKSIKSTKTITNENVSPIKTINSIKTNSTKSIFNKEITSKLSIKTDNLITLPSISNTPQMRRLKSKINIRNNSSTPKKSNINFFTKMDFYYN